MSDDFEREYQVTPLERELARDLIAAQRAVGAQLAAAEATIARVRALVGGLSDLDWDDWTACRRALRAIGAALAEPAKGGE